VLTTLQTDPFQWSASVCCTPFVPAYCPVAQMSFAETAEILDREPLVPGLGLEITLQAVPSQCSMRVVVTFELVACVPTAHTSLLAMAATDMRALFPAPPFGLDTILHAAPSQCSVRVCCAPVYGLETPTAQTSLDDTAATLWN